MRKSLTAIVGLFVIVFAGLISVALAQNLEKRIALVIGNASYEAAPLKTTANDAGLIAQTLQAAGFDVVGARDLDQDSLRRAFRDFVDKAQASGPGTVSFIYFGGYGLQLEGENYIVPVDARIARDTDIPAEAIRLSDYVRPLAALKLRVGFVVLDAARAHPFAKSGSPIAGGLALVEPESGTLIAFNAAPGTVAPEGNGPYGAYAQALAEMLREGGLQVGNVFDRVRLRVNEMTKGAALPWNASRIEANFVFFEKAADAPPPPVSADQTSAIRAKPIRDLVTQDAYTAALQRDTLQDYEEFLAAYPDDPMSKRVQAIIAARREAITWRRTRSIDTPPAYWSYLRRYPRGPHAADARRRLAFLAAMLEPPPSFAVVEYDVPPPPPYELVYIERPVLVFDDPYFGFPPPPPLPVFFLPPPPPYFVVLAPPPPPFGVFLLPVPVFVPVPLWVRAPVYVAPPPNNIFFQNIHNKVVINQATNTILVTNPSGQTQTIKPSAPPTSSTGAKTTVAGAAGVAAAAALAPALPPSVAKKANLIQNQNIQGGKPALGQSGQAAPNQVTPRSGQLPKPDSKVVGKPLPGAGGQPLPTGSGKPVIPGTASPTTAKQPDIKTLHKPRPGATGPAGSQANVKPISHPPVEQPKIEQKKIEMQRIQEQQIRKQKIQQEHKFQQQNVQQPPPQIRQQQIQQQQKVQQQQIRQQQIQQQPRIQQQVHQPQIQRAPPPTALAAPTPPPGKPQKPPCGLPGLPKCH